MPFARLIGREHPGGTPTPQEEPNPAPCAAPARYYEFGDFRVDRKARLLLRHDTTVPLAPKAVDTLLLLVENNGSVVGKDEIMKAVWPDTFVEETSLTQNISALRKVLGESPEEHEYIETIPKRGYRFVASVRASREDLHVPAEAPGTGVAKGAPRTTESASRQSWGQRASAGTALLAACLLLAAAAAWFLRPARPGASAHLTAVPLTTYPGLELCPTFSPDANLVAFSWNGTGQDNLDIYVKQIGRDPPLRLTNDPAPEFSPAWSPDGQMIAFRRVLPDGRTATVLKPFLGGPERTLSVSYAAGLARFNNRQLCWSSDGRWLIGTARDTPATQSHLVRMSVENGATLRITAPPAGYEGDSAPALSPDGRFLAFVRTAYLVVSQLYVLPVAPDLTPAGQPRPVTSGPWRVSSPTWTSDGRAIIFSSERQETPRSLWRMALPAARNGKPGEPEWLADLGEAENPALSRNGRRLAFTRAMVDYDVCELGLPEGPLGTPGAARKLIASTRSEMLPDFSPDGQKLAYISDQSGNSEVWVAERDGSSPIQITRLRSLGTSSPRWSPDSKQLVFVSRAQGHAGVYLIAADGGLPLPLTRGDPPAEYLAPSWSRDGKWIYFASSRGGDMQVWKMRVSGGAPIQITRGGGLVALESVDGRFVYYTKARAATTALWRVPVEGGPETPVLPLISLARNFAVTRQGLFFIPRLGHAGSRMAGQAVRPAATIDFLSFSTGRIRTLYASEGMFFAGLTVSPDERSVVYTYTDHIESDLMLVEAFR